MKCVCPMGGDRTCPDNCIIAAWHSLPDDQKTPARRRPIVEQLAKQGYSQKMIAVQLGVSQNTVSLDLETLSTVDNVKGQGKDTLGRKKSTGRPKGSGTPRKSKPRQTDTKEGAIVALHDQGLTSPKIAAELGIEGRAVRHTLERERIKRDTEPLIDPTTLSMSAQEKFDAAIRAYQRKLDLQFEQRVRDEIKKRIDEMILPHWKQKIDQAQELFKRRRGAMDKLTFNKIRRALHPDSRNSISDKVLGEAFDTFMSLEKYLLDERDSPTDIGPLPESLAEWDKMRAAAQVKRKTKSNSLRPR